MKTSMRDCESACSERNSVLQRCLSLIRLAIRIRKIGEGTDVENIDARWRKRLLTAQQLLRVLERAFELNSAGDSENLERIGFRKDPCAMVKARWPGISTAMISTLEDVENRERIGLRKDRCAMANARWSGISSAIISTLDDVETAVKCDFLQE